MCFITAGWKNNDYVNFQSIISRKRINKNYFFCSIFSYQCFWEQFSCNFVKLISLVNAKKIICKVKRIKVRIGKVVICFWTSLETLVSNQVVSLALELIYGKCVEFIDTYSELGPGRSNVLNLWVNRYTFLYKNFFYFIHYKCTVLGLQGC